MKYSGITYTITNNELVEYASKIGTINNSIYPLLDVHNIDWDVSQLSKVITIPKNAFELFARNVEIAPLSNDDIESLANSIDGKRIRYEGEENYENIQKSQIPIPPTWYTSGTHPAQFVNSAEILDLLDYYAWITSFNYERIKHLYDIQEGTIPMLKFRPLEVTNLGAQIDYITFNIEEVNPIVLTLKPNQTHNAFKDISLPHFNENSHRQFKLVIFGEANNTQITDSSFYNRNGSTTLSIGWQPSSEKSKRQLPPFSGFLIQNVITVSGNTDQSGYGFGVDLYFDGWTPTNSDPNLYSDKWDDCAWGYITFKTSATNKSATKQYAESALRLAYVKIEKDANIFEEIYINDERYIYLERGFFNKLTNNTVYHDKAFIIKYALLSNTSDIANCFKEDASLYNDLVLCDNIEDDSLKDNYNSMIVPNNKPLVIEIYPKYFGDAIQNDKGEYIYIGETDLVLGKNDTPIRVFADSIASNAVDKPIKSIDIDSVNVKKEINGIERRGFKCTFDSISQVISSSTRYHKIVVGTTPTNFIASSRLFFRVVAQDIREIWFIDGNRDFNYSTGLYPSVSSNSLFNIYADEINNIGLKESFVNHSIESGVVKDFYWNLKLPLFTERSWKTASNMDYSTLITRIRPAILGYDKNNCELIYPSADEVYETIKKNFDNVRTIEKFEKNMGNYIAGFPKIQIGYTDAGGSAGVDSNLLLFCKIEDPTRTSTNWVNVSSLIEIDYLETFKQNFGTGKFLDDSKPKSLEAFKDYFEDIEKRYAGDEAITEKGKAFVNRYCAIAIENTSNGIKKYIVFYRPTIPDDLISTNYEQVGSSRSFKLILRIPANSSGNNNGKYPLFAERKLTVNLLVERAKNELSGWATKQSNTSSSAGTAITLEIGKNYEYKQLVYHGKTTDVNLTNFIFTRLTTLYTPIKTTTDTNHYNVVSTIDQNNESTTYYYYELDDSKNTICFHTADKNQSTNYVYKLDESNSLTLLGNLNSDEYFKGIYDGSRQFSFSISRKRNPIIFPKSVFTGTSTSTESNSQWENADAATITDLIWNSSNSCGVVFSGLKLKMPLYHTQQSFEDFEFNVLDDLCSIDINNSICKFYKDIYKNVSSSYIPVTDSGLSFSGIPLQRVSLTINLSKTESNAITNNEQFLNIWNSSISPDRISTIMSGTYNEDSNPYDSSKGFQLNTQNNYNKVYIDDDNTYDLLNMVNIDIYGKVKFKTEFISKALTQQNGSFVYKTIKIKAFAVLPMTDEYQGFCCVANLIIPINN